MRKDHVGRITPRLNKFPYRYVRSRCKFTRDLRRVWRRWQARVEQNRRKEGRDEKRARKAREKHRTLLAELLSPRSTRGTKRKNEIRTVPNGIVRGSTVIDRRSMNGPGIERGEIEGWRRWDAAACTARYAEPIFIASRRFSTSFVIQTIYMKSPIFIPSYKGEGFGYRGSRSLNTFFFFFFFFLGTMECSSKRTIEGIVLTLSRWGKRAMKKKFRSVIRREKEIILSRDNVESVIYTRRRINTRFTISTSPSPIHHERRGEKQFLG